VAATYVPPGETLLVSGMAAGFGEAGEAGGLFELHPEGFEPVDRLSSTGLCIVDHKLVRALRATDPGSFAELLVYDTRGIRQYLRLDEVLDPHDVIWDPRHEAYVIVSSLTNSIHWVATDGRELKRQVLPGAGDSWHVNSLLWAEQRLYAAAFGDFDRHREWKSHFGDRRGLVVDLESGETLVDGLECPHHPRLVDGAWVICDSLPGRLLRADPETGCVRDTLDLAGFTRGIAVTDDHVLVGESPRTRAGERAADPASVAVVDRHSWTLVDRIEVAACEIYDLVLVDEALAEGVRRGFRTNPDRVLEQDQLKLFDEAGVRPRRLWAVTEPLAEEDCRVSLQCAPPSELALHETLLVACVVTNEGGAFLLSAPPFPVHLSYRWRRGDSDSAVMEGEPSRLSRALAPGERAEVTLLLVPPPDPGAYRLEITLKQDGVRWFDEVCPANRICADVRIRPARTAAPPHSGPPRPALSRAEGPPVRRSP
jgi:acetolactate synthase I/II/III large subunit